MHTRYLDLFWLWRFLGLDVLCNALGTAPVDGLNLHVIFHYDRSNTENDFDGKSIARCALLEKRQRADKAIRDAQASSFVEMPIFSAALSFSL